MRNFLEIEGLTQEFITNGKVHTAYRDVNIKLKKGEFLAVLGSSGCGKTTFLRTVGGLLKPTAGVVKIKGAAVTEPGRHCAIVFQTFDQLFPWKTVLNNVTYPLLVKGKFKTKKEARLQALKYLEMVNLTKFRHFYPHNLSGGMIQRVALARALALEPSLILMDEPFASLDADSRNVLQAELKRIWHASGITVLFVTHSLTEAIVLSSRFLVMGDQTQSVLFFKPNPVVGEPGKLNTPQSPGYSQTWGLLSRLIRGNKDP